MSWTLAASLAGVIVAPLLTYFVAVRKQSGRVATTEAETLWIEAEKMRESYRAEAARLRDEVIALRSETVALRLETMTLRSETVALRKEAVRWREEAATLREEAANLRARDVLREEQLRRGEGGHDPR